MGAGKLPNVRLWYATLLEVVQGRRVHRAVPTGREAMLGVGRDPQGSLNPQPPSTQEHLKSRLRVLAKQSPSSSTWGRAHSSGPVAVPLCSGLSVQGLELLLTHLALQTFHHLGSCPDGLSCFYSQD